MPRAFLIKKKRVEVQSLEGEMNNNTEREHISAENKENVETELRTDVRTEDTPKEMVRQRANGKTDFVVLQTTEEEAEEENTRYSSCEESPSSSYIPGTRTSPISGSNSPINESFQQFPTDLSINKTSSSSPALHPHRRTFCSSSSSSPSPHQPQTSPTAEVQQTADTDPPSHPSHGQACRSPQPEEGGRGQQHQPLKPCKRPSDFSTAFLLSHHSTPKRLCSPTHDAVHSYAAAVSPKPAEGNRKDGPHGKNTNIPVVPSPSKYTPPCLSVSTWLDSHPTSSLLASAYQMCRSREDRTSTSSSSGPHSPGSEGGRCFPSPLGLRREDGPSAFRRNDTKRSRELSPRKNNSMTAAKTAATVSPRNDEMSPRERRVPSTSPRDSVFASPHELLTPRLLPPGTLQLGSLRRGTSTSPAHSERTSSGCGSPADSPDGSPEQLSRFPGDLPWSHGHPVSSSGVSPILPHVPSQNPFLPLGLPYLPGLPGLPPALPKHLQDMALPIGYPKALSDGLASAFRSTRPPFMHPATAAAAYYSSMRSAMPYPFPFPAASGGDSLVQGKASVGDESEQQSLERLEMARALRKGSFDPLTAAFQPPASLQSLHVATAGGQPISSPRPSPGSSSASSALIEGVSRRPSDLTAMPGGLSGPAGVGTMGLETGRTTGLKARAKEHHEPVRYQCEACNKSYSTFSGLSKHKQFHCAAQVKKEFSCKHCEKTYVSLGALKMHIRTHTLPCKCQVCGKAFSRPWLLQGHLRTHTGEKPFSCPHCARAFADRSNLRAHLQTHSDVKKYSCRHCSKTFSRMSLLLKHEDSCGTNTV